MPKKEKTAPVAILRLCTTNDLRWVIKVSKDGKPFTSYPFYYGQRECALHDLNVICKALVARGYIIRKEDPETN